MKVVGRKEKGSCCRKTGSRSGLGSRAKSWGRLSGIRKADGDPWEGGADGSVERRQRGVKNSPSLATPGGEMLEHKTPHAGRAL